MIRLRNIYKSFECVNQKLKQRFHSRYQLREDFTGVPADRSCAKKMKLYVHAFEIHNTTQLNVQPLAGFN